MIGSSAQYFETNHLLADLGGHTVRGGAVTLLSHGLKFVVSIVATAILARLLTPQDYGLIGMVAVATNFVAMLELWQRRFMDAGNSDGSDPDRQRYTLDPTDVRPGVLRV